MPAGLLDLNKPYLKQLEEKKYEIVWQMLVMKNVSSLMNKISKIMLQENRL